MVRGEKEKLNSTELYQINKCWDCHNALVDMDEAAKRLHEIFQEIDFSRRQLARLGGVKPKSHNIFQVAIAGCPNSCCQPQIKDFALQGQAVPEIGAGCTMCGLCVAACPDDCIVLGEAGPIIDRQVCLNCGKCAAKCPTGAIKINKRGYRVIRGGKLGRRPQLAQEVCSLTNVRGAAALLRETLDLLLQQGKPGERLGSLLQRLQKVENCEENLAGAKPLGVPTRGTSRRQP
ncbi:nitrite and sulphite reductase 4Fe-4S region [Desulfotomaculum nigrificans CO-1-SRB]|uniref:Nitrite and sulphite reductase 4Fe-4S region n=1 Tax=Desulfotomaculum nigrificans (strain DSM 14880 / VKM B-2319 / CO-1-SRB) TaxID=868595 RepID=F6B3C1_DESCC|nr:4Fe-4S dicluster domain-containing protein [Desulfotomaculum nigrificans]AEF95152.1 nitrite and sulphite reductase 4Fe-4S region [Desulfotomaculum nigrificans CO-1-SRB]